MKLHTIATLSAATLALAACGKKAETTDAGTNMTAPTMANDTDMTMPAATGGQGFANSAAASDAFEIATSRLALTKGNSAAVKKFAQTMIDAHTSSTAKLKTATASAAPAITPDPTLTADQQAKLADLESKSGADFDRAYVAGQSEGHQMTLDMLRSYSSSGDVPALKAFATSMVPIVTAHLNMVKAMKL